MIPQVQDDLKQGFVIPELPTRTLKMNLTQETVAGRTDRLKAMEQAVYLILSIERYDYLIHSWNFGVELRELFGQPVAYCLPEIKRRITEALLQDDRITAVDNFAFDLPKRGVVHTAFTVTTVFGTLEAEKEVVIA